MQPAATNVVTAEEKHHTGPEKYREERAHSALSRQINQNPGGDICS